LFVIRTNRRDELKAYLSEKGIQTGIHYPISLPKLKAYEYMKQVNDQMFANSSDVSLLSLPIGEHLLEEDVLHVSNSIKLFFKNNNTLD
jgi:dTDP-4-amino-4,6-dideoxygalactose transaminase